VTARVSEVSARPAVRERVNAALRMAAEEVGLVVDGRDIGTAVFPGAFLKIFLTASAEERARRRLAERRADVDGADEGALTAEAERLRQRDDYDASRVVDPLARAEDAVELDSTERGRAEIVDEIVRLYEARASRS
ncbi:MAG: (d)CMP kinase, partial [Gemmatimonadota bacterium]